MTPQQISVLVYEERRRQTAKWGLQQHSYPEWMSILTEEVGEAATAANKCHWAQKLPEALRHETQLETELIQCAAVIFQILERMGEPTA